MAGKAEKAAKKAKVEKTEAEKARNAAIDAAKKVGGDPEKTQKLPKVDASKTEADAKARAEAEKKAAAAKAKAEADAKAKADAERRAAEEARRAKAREQERNARTARDIFETLDEDELEDVRVHFNDFEEKVIEHASDLKMGDQNVSLVRQTLLGALLRLYEFGLEPDNVKEAVDEIEELCSDLYMAKARSDSDNKTKKELEHALSIMDSLRA